MSLDDVLQSVRETYDGFVRNVWPNADMIRLQREAGWLRHQLRSKYDVLLRQRHAIERLTQRVAEQEKQTAALTCRIESYFGVGNQIKAYHHALELETLRRTLERDRADLRRIEQSYQRHVTEIAQAEHRIGEIEHLQAGHVRPAGMNA